MRAHAARLVIDSGLVVAPTLAPGVAVQPLTKRLGRRGDLLGLGAPGSLLAAHDAAVGSPAEAFARVE